MLDVELFHQFIGAVLTLFGREIVANLQHRHQVIKHAQTAENGGFLR